MSFIQDTFTDAAGTSLASHAPDSGGSLVAHTALGAPAAVISDANRARNDQGGVSAYYYSAAPASADYSVSADVRVLSTESGRYASVHARMDTSAFTSYGVQVDTVEGAVELVRWNAGTGTRLATYSFTLTSGTTKGIGLSVSGSGASVTIIATIDGVAQTAVVDTDASRITTAGKAGLHLYGGSLNGAGLHIDNFAASLNGQTVTPDDANWFFSPYNWRVSGSSWAQSANPGAYFKARFGGTSVAVNVDVSPLTGASITSTDFPKLAYRVDGGSWTTAQLPSASGSAISLSGLGAGPHQIEVHVKATVQTLDRWTAPANVVRVTSLTLDTGDALLAPALRSGRVAFYGDSITEGVQVGGTGADLAVNDATQTYAALMAASLNSEYGIVGWGFQGYVHAGNGNVPAFGTALSLLSSGQARSFAPTPDYVFVDEGTNDTVANGVTLTESNVTTALAALRSAVGSTPDVRVIVPFGQFNAATITAAFATWGDASARLIDLGSAGASIVTANSGDGLHPNAAGHALLAAAVLEANGAGRGGVVGGFGFGFNF